MYEKKLLVLAVLIVVSAALFGVYRGWFCLTSSASLPDKYQGNISQVEALTDADGDGIDDQTDILQGALAYVQTRPIYRSKYYAGGYPDDPYGVCTDVVAFALLDAGYDLRELVARDIAEHPEQYDVPEPDPDIDFRRVRNLSVFFAGHAVELTTDLSDIEEWQGGDIVVFENHIGIVSDRRNAEGVPYVIHHANPWRRRYEQDILEKRSDMTGHYRFNFDEER